MKITKRLVEHITIQYNIKESNEVMAYCAERIREGYKTREAHQIKDNDMHFMGEAIMELEK